IDALARFLRSAATDDTPAKGSNSRDSTHAFPDGTETWAQDYIYIDGRKHLQYIQAVVFKSSCLMDCHATGADDTHIDNHLWRPGLDGKHQVPTKAGDLAGAVVINLPMEQTYKTINSNRAFLISAAMITAILAMFSSYMIVRYVIVK